MVVMSRKYKNTEYFELIEIAVQSSKQPGQLGGFIHHSKH